MPSIRPLTYSQPVYGYVETLAIAHGTASPLMPGFWAESILVGSTAFLCPSCGDVWGKVQFYMREKKTGEVIQLAYGHPYLEFCSQCPPLYPYQIGGSLLYVLETRPIIFLGFPHRHFTLSNPEFLAKELDLHHGAYHDHRE